MELYITDRYLVPMACIDTFKSLLWVKRYNKFGEFELITTIDYLQYFKINNYILRTDDDTIMVIEKQKIEADAENGTTLTISGRSFEKVLTQRIVEKQINYNGLAEDLIYKILKDNKIPIQSINKRSIPNFYLGKPLGAKETIQKQITGGTIYDAICDICNQFDIGFKIYAEDKNFMFKLYKGNDRSDFVVFSPEFDNLISSRYEQDITNYSNTAFIAGEGEGASRATTWDNNNNNYSGFDRYEIYVDARDISSNQNDKQLTTEEYLTMLKDRGSTKLSNITQAFDGECETDTLYQYRKDWKLGDIVRIESGFGIVAASRIVEVTESVDKEGYKLVPKFAIQGE